MTNSSMASANSASDSDVPVWQSTSTIIGIITCGQPSRNSDRVPSKSNSTDRNPPRGRSGRSTSMSGGNSMKQAPPRAEEEACAGGGTRLRRHRRYSCHYGNNDPRGTPENGEAGSDGGKRSP